jgi:hypothetical protein
VRIVQRREQPGQFVCHQATCSGVACPRETGGATEDPSPLHLLGRESMQRREEAERLLPSVGGPDRMWCQAMADCTTPIAANARRRPHGRPADADLIASSLGRQPVAGLGDPPSIIVRT